MTEKIYQILLELEKGNNEVALELSTKFPSVTSTELSHKLLALGETYYANPNLKNYKLDEIKSLVSRKITEIDLTKILTTEQVALDYAALKLINIMLKDDQLQQLITKLRMYIFDNNIDAGTLVVEGNTRSIDSSILRSCIPYSLFEPEDLIVVSAYNQILANDNNLSDEELIDVVLYAIDKRDIYIASKYLQRLQASQVKTFGTELCEFKIAQILEDEIIHKPFGNNHPYTPQKFERLPREVTDKDEVVISALTNDLENLKLIINVNGTVSEIEAEVVEDVIEFAQFKVGPFSYQDNISYYFETISVKSKSYDMPISKKIVGLDVISVEGNSVEIAGISKKLTINKLEDMYKIGLNEDFNSNVKVVYAERELIIDDTYKINLNESSISEGEVTSYELVFNVDSETKIFGFGERYNEVVQEGEVIDNYVFSQYKDQGIKTYIPMPIGFTNKGFAIATNSYTNTKFYAEAKKISVCIETDTESLYLLPGTYEDQIKQFHMLTSQPEKLANWVYGPWMSSNNWDSQQEVLWQKNKTMELDIPSTVLVIEQWSDEATFYAFNDATYQEKEAGYHSNSEYNYKGRWTDPKAMVDELHAADLKCFLWQIPVIKYVPNIRHLQKNLDEKFAIKNDYVVKHQDGSPYRIAEDWFKDSLVIDFTNEDAKKWWFDKRKYLVEEIGIDGFKTDGGECLFGHDIILNGEQDSKKVRNLYPETYIGSYYNYLKENGDGFTFSRAGYLNAPSYPAHWAGDERSTFDAFDRTIKAGINAGLSGITYWGWDLAGFNGDIPTSELFIRSTQMATFCPIMQYHAESKGEFNQDRTPWNIAQRHNTPEVIDIYRDYAHLRMQLIPYIKQEAEKAIDGGKPLMRAMFLEHDDELLYDVNDQYYFGDSFLVAPIKEEGELARKVVIAENKMIDAFSLKIYNKGIHEVENKLEQFPLFMRTNKLIPMNIKEGLAKGMENKDFENFEYLKFVYTGGNAEIEFDDIKISIKDGKVKTNKSVVIIDLLDELNGPDNDFDWNGNTVSEKRIENEK